MKKNIVCRITDVLFLMSLTLLISGCTTIGGALIGSSPPSFTSGNYIDKDTLSLLKENETTKQEIIHLLGKPSEISQNHTKKTEVLTYFYLNPYSKETKRQYITMYIDNAGILRKLCVNESVSSGTRLYKLRTIRSLAMLSPITKTKVIGLLGKPHNIYPGREGKGEVLNYYEVLLIESPHDLANVPNDIISMNISLVDGDRTSVHIAVFIDDAGIVEEIELNDGPFQISSINHHIEEATLSLLKENQTTKTEILKSLGKPSYIKSVKRIVYEGKKVEGKWLLYVHFGDDKHGRQQISLLVDDTDILREIIVTYFNFNR